MKILIVSQYYYPEPFRVHEICEELVHRGHSVTVITGIPNYPDGNIYSGYKQNDLEECIKGVKVIRCGIRPRKKGYINLFLNYISFWIKASYKIEQIKDNFDVVYSYQLSPITSSKPAIKFARKKQIPSLLYCLDLWPESIVGQIPESNPIFKLTRYISKKIYTGFDKVVVTSPSFIKYLERVCSVRHDVMTYIPQHANDLGLKENVHQSECVNFMFLGNVGESQNVEGLMHAISKVDSSLSFKVHIVGSGSRIDEVMKLSKTLSVEDRVIFHGRQPKERMPEYYKMADVCVVSLRKEGVVGWTIPGKLQEYMSAGKAVLGCIDGDANTIIEVAQCGVCCEAENIDGYAACIIQLINERHKLREYGTNARKYYLEHFTLKKHVDTLEAELKVLVH